MEQELLKVQERRFLSSFLMHQNDAAVFRFPIWTLLGDETIVASIIVSRCSRLLPAGADIPPKWGGIPHFTGAPAEYGGRPKEKAGMMVILMRFETLGLASVRTMGL